MAAYSVALTMNDKDKARQMAAYLDGGTVDHRTNEKFVVTGSMANDAHNSTLVALLPMFAGKIRTLVIERV